MLQLKTNAKTLQANIFKVQTPPRLSSSAYLIQYDEHHVVFIPVTVIK